ncbi:hypothetical protein [Methyloterricola oryzae]|uniref:hypothetical protein n=1 Tax=Methyloterricola oryzae TaxID=1495050 RepID=UPI0005EB96A5|nr:hypothetical protein [Methyloterricola oryzae]
MIRNPELLRNAWLELTAHRLIATPLVILLLIALLASSDAEDWKRTAAPIAIAGFVLASVLWGGRRAYDTIVEEVRAHTWDIQRMSAVSPWSMTWGKILGGNLYTWYVGTCCLATFMFTYDASAGGGYANWPAPSLCLLLVLSALFAHGAGLLSGLNAVRSGRLVKPARNLPITVLGLLLLFWLGQVLLHQADSPVLWYGIPWPAHDFVLGSVGVFAAWSWFGAYRLMSQALAVRLLPWGSLAFVLFLTFYLCGFVDSATWSYPSRFAALGALIGSAATYVEAWKERRDWIAVRRFLRSWRAGSIDEALLDTPSWLVVAAFTLLMSALTGLLPDNQPPSSLPGMSQELFTTLALSPTVFALLMLRDIGLLYFFSLGRRPERAASTTLVYLLLLYIVLPGLLNLIGLGFLAFPAAFPLQPGATWLAPMIAAGHLAAVGWLLKIRLQELGRHGTPAPS